MREELNRSLVVGGVQIAQAVDYVEQQISTWKCHRYAHITRAVSVSGNSEDQLIHLESIFSKPTQDRPVPVAVVCVHFELHVVTGDLTYRFEQESVRHVVGGQCLAPGKYESWLDRIINDKLQVRQLHDLATAFEETRLAPPPLPSEHPSEDENDLDVEIDEVQQQQRTDTASEEDEMQRPDKGELPLDALLANIFDAADEEDEYELTHKEVADLLYATPLGLADWDIKLLLTTATELETGKIRYQAFVNAAPEIIEALLRRRAAYDARKPTTQVTVEAIDLCYGEEIEEITKGIRELFAAQDASGKGSLSRHEFRSCLLSRNERFSSQEVQMLMQMCKEDDFGQVPYDEFGILLQSLRIDALHNALVETDVQSLRTHLILLMRVEGLSEDRVMPIWNLKNVLLSADQLCLSRMQIHVILSIVHPNELGEVDVEYFLRVCCTVIPQMFDTVAFTEKAQHIAKDKADALAKQEMEELQGITSSMSVKHRANDEDEDDVHANAPDRDAVEKAMAHVCTPIDDRHRQQPTLDVMKFVEAMHHEQVQQCQLSEAELRGFIAEAEIDESGEIAYVDHIKTWVPIVFELRKSRVYDVILQKDWGMDAQHLLDLSDYELVFPLHVLRTASEDSREGDSRSSSISPRHQSSTKRQGRGGPGRQSDRSSLSSSGGGGGGTGN
eukprot:TRINITY_DN74471_c0_g1_i1.p1 TRINITY_DN74471_c0_g1~~TRINITY_DN74471_c0_g1_i1.p1  ORF type:complete len:673 (+),score=144.94 TRINITY_DN74471_c0_g1_i1:200-2218(+)